MTLTGDNSDSVRLFHQSASEHECVRGLAWTGKNSRVRNDSNDASQDLRRDTVSLRRIHHGLQPCTIPRMIGGIVSEGVYQYVNVREDHGRPSMRSSSVAESSRSTPGTTPPPAVQMGSFTGGRFVALGRRASAIRRPCSINAVRVVRRRAASRFACSSSDSFSRTVVRICRSILGVCLYVNQ